MNYDSIATIYVGEINIEQCPEVRYQLLISTDDQYFKERFHSWQLEQHLAARRVLVKVMCTPVTKLVDIETRFILPSEKPGDGSRHISADVVAYTSITGNYSRISIGVLLRNYKLVQR